MREVAAIGLGMHPWGKFPDKSVTQLCREAVEAAVRATGYAEVRVDPEGYRRGRLNEALRVVRLVDSSETGI